MSVIVAVKDEINKRFVIASDSQATLGQVKLEVTKIAKASNNKEVVIGGVGSARDFNILSTLDDVIDMSDTRREIVDINSIITKTVPKIEKALKDAGRVMGGEHGQQIASSFLIAYKDRAWIIGNDLCVSEISNFGVIGAPWEMAIGAYEILKEYKNTPEEMAGKAVDVCIRKTNTVNYPILITTTTTDAIEVYDINKKEVLT
jgi:ATP-dependent protease HslVU (ClpYQ) peptidase subunit